MSDEEKFAKRIDRERRARKAAEKLLEEKSAELFEANERQRKSAERLQSIMDTVPDAILTSKDGIIRSWNESALAMFACHAENFDGSMIDGLFEADSDTAEPIAIQSGDQRTARRSDGTCFPVELSLARGTIAAENIDILILRDITARENRDKKNRELQHQLDQSQKFEAIGTLASGIAHEINTPIQYISDNLRFLTDAWGDLTPLIAAYQKFTDDNVENDAVKTSIAELKSMADEADLPFLLEELPNATRESLSGAEQVSKIVQAAKEFSHPGEGERQLVDLNKTIENAATLSRNEWKTHAELTLQLDESIPQVPCLAAEVNQVVLNILINASHAMESRDDIGSIQITTSSADGHNEIRIADNGCGMPDDVREQIFVPFFTTKGVGKGTGQGLSIAFDTVVNKHGGTLEVESEQGVGTTFIIRLPIEKPDMGLAAE